jgi:hypothetical protein
VDWRLVCCGEEVGAIFATKRQNRDGVAVPDSEDVRLGNDAVKLVGTVLYADLEDSTDLVDQIEELVCGRNLQSILSHCMSHYPGKRW